MLYGLLLSKIMLRSLLEHLVKKAKLLACFTLLLLMLSDHDFDFLLRLFLGMCHLSKLSLFMASIGLHALN